MILDTHSGRIQDNWSVVKAPGGFHIVAPFNDGLPGKAVLGNFQYRPHAEIAARAPALAEALDKLLDRYTSLVNCGDCGVWDPEKEDEVIAARAALATSGDFQPK